MGISNLVNWRRNSRAITGACIFMSIATPAECGAPAPLAIAGLNKIVWGMSEADVRSMYPNLGSSGDRRPKWPEEWLSLRTDYEMDGCIYLLRMEGVDDKLFGSEFSFISGDAKHCREKLIDRINGAFGGMARKGQESRLVWGDGKTIVVLQPNALWLSIQEQGPGNPYWRI